MGKTETSRIDALDALLAEKRKHEGYLAKLEERRAATPAHVFSRLRDEYLTKLTDLQVRASAEAENLSEGLLQDQAAIAEIEGRLGAVTEERIEGELRAEVGEYDPKAWTKKLESLDSSIAKITTERDARVAIFEQTRALLVEARGAAVVAATMAPDAAAPASMEPARAAPTPSAPQPRVETTLAAGAVSAAVPVPVAAGRAVPATPDSATARVSTEPRPSAPVQGASPDRSVAPAHASAPAAPRATTAAPAKTAPMAGSPSFDELAFLNSVVGRVSTPVRVDPPPPIPSPTRPSDEFRKSGSGTPVVPAAPVVPPVRSSAAAKAPQEAITEPRSAREPDEPASALGRPTPRTSQAIKTLKCQECGTFNFPTEWYCERCGGELAAL